MNESFFYGFVLPAVVAVLFFAVGWVYGASHEKGRRQAVRGVAAPLAGSEPPAVLADKVISEFRRRSLAVYGTTSKWSEVP